MEAKASGEGQPLRPKWYTSIVLWPAATDNIDLLSAVMTLTLGQFSVERAGGLTTEAVDSEVYSCQDEPYGNEAVWIADLEIYIRVD